MCKGVSTGESGLLVDAIIHWDEIKLGKKIHDYKTTRMEYLDKVDANLGACRDIGPGWGGSPEDVEEEEPANLAGCLWGDDKCYVLDDCELCMFSCREMWDICRYKVIPKKALKRRYLDDAKWLSRVCTTCWQPRAPYD